MRNMKLLIYIFLFVLTLSSCAPFMVPEMKGKEKISVQKLSKEEIKVTISANMLNENWFALKIKPSVLDLYVEDELIGEVKLDEKVKLKRKRETEIDAPLTLILSSGVYAKLLRYAMQKEVKVRIKGKAKGGVFIFSKKFDVDETKAITMPSLF